MDNGILIEMPRTDTDVCTEPSDMIWAAAMVSHKLIE